MLPEVPIKEIVLSVFFDYLYSIFFFLRCGFKTVEQNGGKRRNFLLQDIMVAIHLLNLLLRMILVDFKAQAYHLNDHVHVGVLLFPHINVVLSQGIIHHSFLIISLRLIPERVTFIRIIKTDIYAIQIHSAVFIDKI